VRRQIANRKNQLYLSPISIWEAQNVVRSKKLRIATSFSQWLEESLSQLPVQEAPLNFAVAAQAGQITLPQSDIGGVFIAATACA
jgi:PIN domain nuclease of toxin-antitoxin system